MGIVADPDSSAGAGDGAGVSIGIIADPRISLRRRVVPHTSTSTIFEPRISTACGNSCVGLFCSRRLNEYVVTMVGVRAYKARNGGTDYCPRWYRLWRYCAIIESTVLEVALGLGFRLLWLRSNSQEPRSWLLRQ